MEDKQDDQGTQEGYNVDSKYESMTMDDLRPIAAERGIMWRGLRKADLIDLLATQDRLEETEEDAEEFEDEDEPEELPEAPPEVPEPPPRPDVPQPVVQHYRVMKTSRFCPVGGPPTRLAEGKVISELTHDMAAIQAQGVPLEKCAPYTLKRDAYGQIILPHGREFGPQRVQKTVGLSGHRLGSVVIPDGKGGTELELSEEAAAFEEAKAHPRPPMGGKVE